MPPPPLPQELKKLIIHHANLIPDNSDHIKTLGALALASQDFRYPARRCIFSAVEIEETYDGNVTTSLRTQAAFTFFTISSKATSKMIPIPRIASYISFTVRFTGDAIHFFDSLEDGVSLLFSTVYSTQPPTPTRDT
ncbi:unnamed protein product [Cyclocybe aegerita]|uniref:Uncharacterized protein n=1 Tax=Cyclocybe aegerita TaxID=1973307 RepID=A0A8S0W8E5_CYCAE|nr:unnamed protein product [Cyclocybe aegerita]